jgi:hypothetical protein
MDGIGWKESLCICSHMRVASNKVLPISCFPVLNSIDMVMMNRTESLGPGFCRPWFQVYLGK